MFDSIGERKQRRAQRRRALAFGLCVLAIAVGGMVYLFSPHEQADPMDVVQGTGADLGEYEFIYDGPSELEVRWDKAIGEAWSISWAKGWIRNVSAEPVSFAALIYRVKDAQGNILWEEQDARFPEGFTLEPAAYINFDIMPICKRPARVFELAVEGALVTE